MLFTEACQERGGLFNRQFFRDLGPLLLDDLHLVLQAIDFFSSFLSTMIRRVGQLDQFCRQFVAIC